MAFNPKGEFSVKSAYEVAVKKREHERAREMAKGRKLLIGKESGSCHSQTKSGCLLFGAWHITAWQYTRILLEEG